MFVLHKQVIPNSPSLNPNWLFLALLAWISPSALSFALVLLFPVPSFSSVTVGFFLKAGCERVWKEARPPMLRSCMKSKYL